MRLEALQPVGVDMAHVEQAHAALNAAYNAVAVDRRPATLVRDTNLARGYVHEARIALTPTTGHDGRDEAAKAARAVLPRLERALQMLDVLAATRDPLHVEPLLDELGIAMDHVEAALAAVGWD